MEYRIKLFGTDYDVFGWTRTPTRNSLSHSEDFRLILADKTCRIKVEWIYENAYPVEVVHIKRTAAQARRHARKELIKMNKIFGMNDGKHNEPVPPQFGWRPEDFDEVKFNTGHTHACEVAFMPHTVEEARIVQEKLKSDDESGLLDFKPISADEMYALYVKEKLAPGEAAFVNMAEKDMGAAIKHFQESLPIKRRQFFAEMLEHTLRIFLEQLQKHPTSPRARKAMQDAIEKNRTWAKNNLASIAPDDPESGLFRRYVELCDQYEGRAAALLTTPTPPASVGPDTLQHIVKSVDALHTKADAIHGHAAAAHANTDELKATVPPAIQNRETTIREQHKVITKLKAMLSARLTELFAVYRQIDPEDMAIFCEFMKTGNQVRAADAVDMKEQTLRARVARWQSRGPAYARLHDLYTQQRESRRPLESQFHENLAAPEKPTPAIDAGLLRDIAEIVADMNQQNLEAKREEILSKYLRDYTMT